MRENTASELLDKERAEYMAACAALFDLNSWLEAKANRARYEAADGRA